MKKKWMVHRDGSSYKRHCAEKKNDFSAWKCLAMLKKQWTMSSVRPSNSGCTWIVERALRYCS